MPTYPLKNLKTGETKTLNMTMQSYDEFRSKMAMLIGIETGHKDVQELEKLVSGLTN